MNRGAMDASGGGAGGGGGVGIGVLTMRAMRPPATPALGAGGGVAEAAGAAVRAALSLGEAAGAAVRAGVGVADASVGANRADVGVGISVAVASHALVINNEITATDANASNAVTVGVLIARLDMDIPVRLRFTRIWQSHSLAICARASRL